MDIADSGAWLECFECQWPALCELDDECVIVWDLNENLETSLAALLASDD